MAVSGGSSSTRAAIFLPALAKRRSGLVSKTCAGAPGALALGFEAETIASSARPATAPRAAALSSPAETTARRLAAEACAAGCRHGLLTPEGA